MNIFSYRPIWYLVEPKCLRAWRPEKANNIIQSGEPQLAVMISPSYLAVTNVSKAGNKPCPLSPSDVLWNEISLLGNRKVHRMLYETKVGAQEP